MLELSQNIVIGTTYVVNSISQSVTILYTSNINNFSCQILIMVWNTILYTILNAAHWHNLFHGAERSLTFNNAMNTLQDVL